MHSSQGLSRQPGSLYLAWAIWAGKHIYKLLQLGLFGMVKLELALQFIVTNAYFSVTRALTLVLHATLK